MRSFEHMRVSPSFAKAGVAAIESGRASLQRSSNWFGDYGMSVVANAIWIVIVPIVAFWALRDFHTILAKGLMLVPPHRRELVKMAVSEVTSVFGKYLRGLAIVSALNGIATAGLLSILHVPGALILGVVAGLLYSVPYIGALLTLVATGAVAFVGGGPSMLVVALGASVVLHQILFDQIITPRILGAQVGLHPILSIVALLVGNLLLGVMGMVLAVPVAACIQIAVLAVVPKLSQEIEIATPTPGEPVTVQQLEAETKGEHIKADATEEMHAAVTAAVESIEQAVEESTEANAAP
jgi:predicted PurR-regulated permease PerM